MLRRILPQLAAELVDGHLEPLGGMEDVGHAPALGRWQKWPAGQAAAVWSFLHAWWAYTLTAPKAAVPAYDALAVCAEASGRLHPWLEEWEKLTGPVADQRPAAMVACWEGDLPADRLPWYTGHDEEELRTTLTAWLACHAPVRLRARGAPERLLHRVRLLGLPWDDRWRDPYWSGDGL